MNNFKVVATLGNGQRMEILCEKKQIPMVKRVMKDSGAMNIKVEPDFNYGK